MRLIPSTFARSFIVLFVFAASDLHAGDPLFNLPWFLKDTVVATIIAEEEYRYWRTSDVLSVETELRRRAGADTVWIERLPTQAKVSETSCEDFGVSRHSDWLRQISKDQSSVPQWREAWHGVAVRTQIYRSFLPLSGVRRIELVAAVKAPGISKSALDLPRGGAIKERFFRTASTYKAAGFDRMAEIVRPMAMTLTKQNSCDGFMIYHWVFES